eukprot:scaffold307_cov390-Prasinococcus_capsulatus_cf.AAC.18
MQRLLEKVPPCMLATKACANSSWIQRHFDKIAARNVPNLSKGEFGTCAVVGSADSLLHDDFGSIIDAHNTVIRYNSILLPKHTGERTHVLIYKDEYRQRNQEDPRWRKHVPLIYMLNQKQTTTLSMRGRPVLVLGPGQDDFDRRVRDFVYRIYMDDKRLSYKDTMRPTTGFKRVMAIVASGLCTRVDLYGFSSGGGKYFHQKAKPLKHHLLAAEHYAFRVLMSNDQMCVYGQ